MDNRKIKIRFFTIADYEEEEKWLRAQHNKGWKLKKTIVPCFYIFESCVPCDTVYRLDYKNNTEGSDYYQIFRDYGWEYFNRCMGWLYFRKPISHLDEKADYEIFSDNRSRLDMIAFIIKTRMLPLLIIFFSSMLPSFIRSIHEYEYSKHFDIFTVVIAVLFLLYCFLFLYCGIKLQKLKHKYKA